MVFNFEALMLKALKKCDPETAHNITIMALKNGYGALLRKDNETAFQTLAVSVTCDSAPKALNIRSCVGLAAGFDKNAEVAAPMFQAGFGFVECGTVTPLAQTGNPKPRLFRLTQDEAVINRMGFNNAGLDVFARNIKNIRSSSRAQMTLGLNIGANKDSQDRIGDYEIGLRRLWGLGDYFTINISSPNTPGLRALQGEGALDELLGRLAQTRLDLRGKSGNNYPIFLKIAPDLTDTEIETSVIVTQKHGFEGMIVSNTTLDRESLQSRHASQTGGLSGAPLFEKSTRALKIAYAASKSQSISKPMVFVGAGGIGSGHEAYAKIKAGASLVQLYSMLVYRGLGLVDEIKRDLVLRLKADGFNSVSQAVGSDTRI